jgi:hypothetical protein
MPNPSPSLSLNFHTARIIFSSSLLLCSLLFGTGIRDSHAQSSLDIRGSLSFKISKGRLIFNVGEIANLSRSNTASGKLEVTLWLSRKPYDSSSSTQGNRIASCTVAGILGGETAANLSCQAKLRFLSRGKYYAIITLSEFDTQSDVFVVRDTFTFSKRVRL